MTETKMYDASKPEETYNIPVQILAATIGPFVRNFEGVDKDTPLWKSNLCTVLVLGTPKLLFVGPKAIHNASSSIVSSPAVTALGKAYGSMWNGINSVLSHF